jgi:hypothetical protein
MTDCRQWQRPADELPAVAGVEAAGARAFVAAQHGDAERTCDPRITPLRRRHKVLIAPGALDDLLDGDEE